MRPEVRREGEIRMEQNVQGINRQVQPAAAACHEGAASLSSPRDSQQFLVKRQNSNLN